MAIEISGVSAAGSAGVKQAAFSGAGSLPEVQGMSASSSADAQRFGQALASYKNLGAQPAPTAVSGAESTSVGRKLISSLSDMSGRLKADHKHVSSMIEKATVGGDNALMMRAMMALTDYQQRVQVISKTVTKAASSLDQLTRLQ